MFGVICPNPACGCDETGAAGNGGKDNCSGGKILRPAVTFQFAGRLTLLLCY